MFMVVALTLGPDALPDVTQVKGFKTNLGMSLPRPETSSFSHCMPILTEK